MKLHTPHLCLVPATADLIEREMHDPEAFGQALQAHIPVNWPPELLTDALPWFLQQLSTTPQLSEAV